MADDLGVLISASIALDEQAAVKDINRSLKSLATKVDKLNIKLNIDDSIVQTINKFNIAMEKQSAIIKETTTTTHKLDGSIEKVKEQHLASGDIITQTTKKIREENQSLVSQIKTLQQLEKELNGYTLASQRANKNQFGQVTSYSNTYRNNNNPNDKITVRSDQDGNIKNLTAINNYLKQKESLLKQEEALDRDHYNALKTNRDKIEAMDKLHYLALKQNAALDLKQKEIHDKQYEAMDRAHYQALKTNREKREAMDKMHYLALQRNEERERQYLKSVAEAELKITDIRRRFGSDKSVAAGLNDVEAKLSRLKEVGSVGNFKGRFEDLNLGLRQVAASAKTATSNTISFGEAMKTAFQKFPIWMIATTAFYAPLRAIQSGIQYIYDLDSAMIDLQKVTENTSIEYQNFIKGAQGAANEIGSLTLDIVKSTTEWARLGYTLKEAQQLAKQTTVYKNVGDIKSAEDASEALIASIKGFGIEVDVQGKNIERVVDVYNEVGNRFAISSAGIGEAVKRSAASLSSAGNTLEESVAMITAANTTIQEPTRVGNALKTVSMRIRGVSDEGEDLSNLVPKLEENFRAMGLTLKKDNNTFKSTYEIFSDLSEVWGSLSDMKQAEILELVAGKHQGNVVASMLKNWQDAEGALEAGLNSFGSAAQENEKYLESIEGKVNQFKNAVGSFWSESISSEDVKILVEFGTEMVKSLSKLTESFGLVNTAVGIASFAIIAFNKNLRSNAVSMFGIDLKSVALATKVFTGSTIAARVAVIGLQTAMTMGLSLAIVGINALITKLIEKHQEQKKIQEELEKQNKTIAESWLYQKDKVQDLVKEYLELNEATSNGNVFDNIEQEQRYKNIIEELSELMPNLVKSIDDKGNKHLKNAKALEEELRYAERLSDIEQQQLIIDAEVNFKSNLDKINKIDEEISKTMNNIVLGGIMTQGGFIPYSESEIKKMEKQIISLQSQASTYSNILRDSINDVTRAILNQNNIKMSDNVSKQLNNITDSLNVSQLDPKQLNERSHELATFIASLNKLNTIKSPKELEKTRSEIDILAKTLGIPADKLEELIISFGDAGKAASNFFRDTFGYDYSTDGLYNLDNALKTLSDSFDTAKDNVSPLNQLLIDMDKGQSQSATSMSDLIKKYPELSKHVKKAKDGYVFERDAVEKLRQSKIDLFKTSITNEKNRALDLLNNSIKNLKSYGLELKAIENLVDAKQSLQDIDSEIFKTETSAGLMDRMLYAGLGDYTEQLEGHDSLFTKLAKERSAALRAEYESIKGNTKAFEDLLSVAESYLTGINDSTLGTSLEKDSKSAKQTTEELSKLQRQINEVESAIKKIQNQHERYAQSSQKYRDALAKENSLWEQKKKLLEEGIKNPVSLLPVKTETSSGTKSTSSSYAPIVSSDIDNMLSQAASLQGKFTYGKIGGKFQGTFDEFKARAVSDCSQFVQEMFDEFLDIQLPRVAAEQAKQGTKVDKKDLKKGDLVFFKTTSEDNSHVGIYMGDSKFIHMGDKSGLSTQNLNSKYWSEKYQGAKRVINSNSVSTSASSSGKVKEYTSKDLEEAKNKAEDETMSANNEIYQNRLKTIGSWSKHYQIEIDDIDRSIRASERNQSNFTEFSPRWRKEQEEQIKLLEDKSKALHEQRNQIKYLSNEWQIESDDISDQIKGITENQEEIKFEISDKQLAIINSNLDEFADRVSDVGYELDVSRAKMESYEEGSVEYAREVANQIGLTRKQIDINKESITYIEQQLKSERLSAAAKEELTQKVRGLVLANYDLAKSNKDLMESYVDGVINDFKKMYEQKRDLELEALDAQIKAEEKRHKQFMDNIDEEDKRFEEYINRQIKLLDRQSASDDYETELQKKLKERQKIQDSLNKWSMDDSMEGKAKRAELQEQLDKADEEIERFKLERERVVRKEGLQDQLDDRKKYNEKVKKDEDKTHDKLLDNIEEEKKKTQQKYKDILEDEQYFYDLKKRLLSEDMNVQKSAIHEMELEYDKFFGNMKKHAFETSKAYQNMSYVFEQHLDKLKNLPTEIPTFPNQNSNVGSGNSGNTGNSNSSSFTPAEQSVIDKMKANSREWAATKDKAEKDKLAAANLELSKQIPGSWRDEKTGIWYKGKTPLYYHKGGEVGTEGTTTKNWFNKILQSDEVPAILRKKEVVLDEPISFVNDLVSRVINNITNPLKNLSLPELQQPPSSSLNSGGTNIENVIIYANDKDTGTSLLSKFASALNKSNKRGTFKRN